jgi:hypothetical protein
MGWYQLLPAFRRSVEMTYQLRPHPSTVRRTDPRATAILTGEQRVLRIDLDRAS